jgi:hypothetical protein
MQRARFGATSKLWSRDPNDASGLPRRRKVGPHGLVAGVIAFSTDEGRSHIGGSTGSRTCRGWLYEWAKRHSHSGTRA